MNVALSPLETFRTKGVPHRRIEAWKYTDVRAVLDAETVAHTASVDWHFRDLPQGIELVPFANGAMPAWAADRMKAVSHGEAMDAAAWAFSGNGVALRVPHDMKIVEPVRLEFRSAGHGQVVLVLENGASATLVEDHKDGEGLRNISFSFFLEDGAALTHCRRAEHAGDLVSIETIQGHAAQDARYSSHYANFGAKLSRTEVALRLAGKNAQALLSGVSVLSGTAHADVTTHIEHAVGNTMSRQLFKNVCGGKSRAIYQGKITVRPGANGSDSRQTAKALLLGARAEADLKPELEIFADDVKCAHGAAVGDLDIESLFYLRSRGIAESEARLMLIRAFLEEAIAEVSAEDMRDCISAMVEKRLALALEDAP